MSNKNNKELSQLLEYIATRDVIRIDMAFCDPITREWYKSDVRVLDLEHDSSEAINQIYSSAISAISDIYGVPINYLTQHHKDGHDIKPIYSFKADETQILELINHCKRCGYKSIDIHVVDPSLYESAKVAFLDKYDTFQQIGSNNEEKFAYIQEIFAKYIFSNTKLIKNICIIPNVISFRGEEYLSSFCILSAIDFNRFGPDVNRIRNVLRENAYDELVQCLYNNSLKEAIKSAKTAIMSRNMSHNLGSHVMFYIKQKLQSVSKIVGSDVLHNIIPGDFSDLNEIQKKVEANTEIELPFLVGLGRFINYLQERQDYIATVATDYIPAKSTISFKDFIYDELKPDLRYMRHHSNGSKTDAGWQPKNLLLDYIAYSEGYRTSDDIVIRFGKFDGKSPVKDSPQDEDFQKLRKFNIAVPGGVIGRQAIFSIVENIIRNAAKHSEKRSDGKLELELSLLTKKSDLEAFKNDGFRWIPYNENSANEEECNVNREEKGATLVEKYAKYWDKFHILRIKLDMPNKSSDIDAVVKKLAEPYIEKDGGMKETAKGLKEMRISASWLRGYSIDSEIPQGEPPVLAVYSEEYKESTVGNTNGKVSLSYFLCIPKPCRVAFVVPEAQYNKVLDDNIRSEGCAIFKKTTTNEDGVVKHHIVAGSDDKKAQSDALSELANYEIVCMSDEDKDLICPRISSRYIANEDKVKTILEKLRSAINESEEIKAIIDSIYEEWLKAEYPNGPYKLLVADEKAADADKKSGSVLEDDGEVVLTKTGEDKTTSDWNSDNAVVYLTHFEGLSSSNVQNESYYPKILSAASLESVTGNNSTDRLIRQETWTKEWKSKHISAGLARVAIFDERIFQTAISSKSQTAAGMPSVDDIKTIKNENQTLGEFTSVLEDRYKIDPGVSRKLYKAADSVIPEILETLSLEYKYDIAQKNHERRVWAFNVRVENRVEIVGYNVSIGECVGEFVNHSKDAPITVAKIVKKEGDYVVELCDGGKVFKNNKSDIFDYITIHQGVLDKIYGAFGVKTLGEKEIDAAKRKITNAIHRGFSRHDTPESVDGFLPNFIIHSGRSKPSAEDMPQEQPFVQFAAIDHAVNDCKYTLVELLATAHYEKCNNNH